MAKNLTSVLGVDIGSSRIKVAEIRSQGREPVVTSLGIIDTPEGAVDHTGVFNSDAVASALKTLMGQSGITVGDVVVSIAGQASVLVRTLEVPRMNPAELKEHMQWEINRNIPFAESTVVSDFKPLADEDPSSQNMDVVMAISPQSAIDTVMSCVRKAGKKVSAIDVEPMGLGRSLLKSYDDETRGQTVCVVDVGHKTTSINIYRNGKQLMPRQVPVGGEMFTKAIADSLVMSVAEAEKLKQESAEIPQSAINGVSGTAGGGTAAFQAYNPFADEPAVPGGEPTIATPPPAAEPPADAPAPAAPAPVSHEPVDAARLYGAFSSVLDEFTAEIRRSIDYFRSRGGDINRVMICGGGAHLKGLPEYIGAALGLPCDAYDPTRRLNLSMKKVAPGFAQEHAPDFAIAIGNGLHIFFD
ncbi:MAG TPA: type IV pilus assembly protein PilM [Fimbriimonadaceae bacterium]|nr:type IV pilus assembly protein PilM [Fimbriimonadaceae bacterium]